MIIMPESMNFLFVAFRASYMKGFANVSTHALEIALDAKSGTSQEMYPFLGQWPGLREWIGDRVIDSLSAHEFTIKNRKFESTVSVPREKIEDDQYALFGTMFEQMGRVTKQHPDKEIFGLLKQGFSTRCYDKQNFFDADHPTGDENGETITVSNFQDGAGPAWYLLDTAQPVKPMVWQTRIPYEFQAIVASHDKYVFLEDEYVYGVRARVNAGFGLWQLAYASKAALTADNFAAARQFMAELRGDRGQILGVEGNTLVVPPSLEKDARTLLKATSINATTNVWHESAKLIVTPFVA